MEYRLIKKYPGNEKLGVKSRESICKEYPEFWEPIDFSINSVNNGRIISVKCNNTGEIFYKEDKVFDTELKKYHNIDDFVYYRDNIYLKTKDYSYKFIKNRFNKDKVLFTTEDGIDIKKGDCFMYINKKSMSLYGFINATEYTTINDNILTFADREKAVKALKEYKLVNKPLFSVNEIVDYIISNLSITENSIKKHHVLLKLAEDKLKING